MKIFGAVLCILLLAGSLFFGAGAAIEFYSDAVVNPSGDLKFGDKVSVDMTFTAVGSELTGLSFSTPLEKTDWVLNFYNGNKRVFNYTPNGSSFELPVWPNREDMEVSVVLSLTGTVPMKMSGHSVSMLEIAAKDGSKYASPVQRVVGSVYVTPTKSPSENPAATQTYVPVARISFDKKAFSVSPSKLSVGKYVQGEMVARVPEKLRAEVVLSSPLENVHFSVSQVCSDGRRLAYLQGNGSPYVVPASTVYVDEGYNLVISFTGTVPEKLAGEEFSLLSVDAGEHGSFVSPVEVIAAKEPVVSPMSDTNAGTDMQSGVPTVVQTEVPSGVSDVPAVSEPQSYDLIAMFVNWVKSLFG
ncbi:MAG TPA: hypothetical protein O0X39_03235 [Methanocorpusculum sp.]|nr:hypothetical protein [Methanocorpusculum sp.]